MVYAAGGFRDHCQENGFARSALSGCYRSSQSGTRGSEEAAGKQSLNSCLPDFVILFQRRPPKKCFVRIAALRKGRLINFVAHVALTCGAFVSLWKRRTALLPRPCRRVTR